MLLEPQYILLNMALIYNMFKIFLDKFLDNSINKL